MSIKKQYLNDHWTCKVTFTIPKNISKASKRAHVLGDFNNWSCSGTPMKKRKNGAFVAVVELPIGREYQFRYLLDNEVWVNDSDADSFVPAPIGKSKNCVLITYNDSHLALVKANQLKPRSAGLAMGNI